MLRSADSEMDGRVLTITSLFCALCTLELIRLDIGDRLKTQAMADDQIWHSVPLANTPDPNDSNFMVDDEGLPWAIDFGRTCFLPPSFVSFSFVMSWDGFVHSVARRVKYTRSANVPAMIEASGQLVIFGDNALGRER